MPGDAAPVVAARARGIPVWSEIELGYRLLGVRLVGVTGTNGKTTTSELFRRDARRAPWVAGNGPGALRTPDGAVEPGRARGVRGLELPARGTRTPSAPAVAVLLNLEPDHLDRHGTFEAYRDAKLRIFENQGAGDTAVVPRGLPAVPGSGRRIEFDRDDPLPAEPRIPGAHNRENAAAAVAAARAAGAVDDDIGRALETFPGVAHRLEPVGEVRGVLYVNDSKATNVAAARRGIAAYADRPLQADPRRLAQGRGLRPARRGPRPQPARRLSDRRDRRRARRRDPRGGAVRRPGDSRRHGGPRGRAGRCRAVFLGLRELRPVPRLRGARRGLPQAGRKPALTSAGVGGIPSKGQGCGRASSSFSC